MPCNNYGSQRRIAARNSLAHQNHIRRRAPVFHGERPACAPHSRHHFVGDQKNSMLAANFRNSLNVTFRRRHCAQGCSHGWLENKCRHVFRTVAFQHAPEFVRALHVAFRITKPVRTSITIARRNVSPLRQHRRERLAPPDVSGNRQSPQRAAVITLQAGNHAESFFLPAFYPVLPRQLQRRFRGLRPARSKINAAAPPHSLRCER